MKVAKSAAWPAEKTVYDWCYSHEAGGWVDWMDTVPPFVPDPDASFSQIIVPTSDTVRYNYVLRILVAAGKHVLYVGETGTGEHYLPYLFLMPTSQSLLFCLFLHEPHVHSLSKSFSCDPALPGEGSLKTTQTAP